MSSNTNTDAQFQQWLQLNQQYQYQMARLNAQYQHDMARLCYGATATAATPAPTAELGFRAQPG